MENWIVAASNVYALRAIAAWPLGSVGQWLCVAAALASTAYHLIECKKHHMPGVPGLADYSWTQHYRLLNLDRAAAAALGLYLAAVAWRAQRVGLIAPACAALAANALSELFRYVQITDGLCTNDAVGPRVSWRLQRAWYMCWHCAWHVAAFHLAYVLANA
jgi:hypothetical protein